MLCHRGWKPDLGPSASQHKKETLQIPLAPSIKATNPVQLKQHPNVCTNLKLKTIQYITTDIGPEGAISWQYFQQFHVRSKGSLGILANAVVAEYHGSTKQGTRFPMTAWSRHSIHWNENVSSLQSQPSVDALLCEFDWEFKQHDTHTHKSTANISLTAQMEWDHNLPKKKWKDRQVFFNGILIVKGQLHIRQFETLFWWHRLWCLGVCWGKWMHFS